MPPQTSFQLKKSTILDQLSVPATSYNDLSPKGSVDAGIRDLIDEINTIEGYVTTSSCAGRVSVFLEGERRRDNLGSNEDEDAETRTRAGVGGKGGDGRWLFVSHDPVDLSSPEFQENNGGIATAFGMKKVEECGLEIRPPLGQIEDTRFIHLKFEPFILHILTDSAASAQTVLKAALQAGFRESGAINITTSASSSNQTLVNPIVAVRSMGLSLESIIGIYKDDQAVCIVPEWQLRTLLEISNQRFIENTKRINRFRELLFEQPKNKGPGEKVWEDANVRRERMRAEGLKKREALKQQEKGGNEVISETIDEFGLDIPGP